MDPFAGRGGHRQWWRRSGQREPDTFGHWHRSRVGGGGSLQTAPAVTGPWRRSAVLPVGADRGLGKEAYYRVR